MQRILVIDDSAETRKLLRVILEIEGYEVDVAGTAAEGLRKLPRIDPHLLLLDLKLPDGDGFSVARAVRSHPAWSSMPIVLVSAHGDLAAESAAKDAGCARFLRKPLEPHEIVRAVRAAIAEARHAARPGPEHAA